MIKAILFDFNGVIIDDEPLQMKAYQEILKEEAIELTEKDYYDSLGMDDVMFIRTAYDRAKKDLDDATLERILERKSEAHGALIADELPLFPGVVNFVKMAHFHYALGIVSMARSAEINSVLQRADLAGYFTGIVSAEDVTACKPDPQCFNLGFRRLDEHNNAKGEFPLVREQILVIEDSPPGVVAAKAAGMRVLGVTNTVSEKELRAAGADSVTKNLSDWIPETVELVFK
ncbi:MAG TPA: HAD family phosphatase [Pyrinomonadaceae bacterium]|nr:HAD family phosphatase [Pyrinomonadaceae bacterium]